MLPVAALALALLLAPEAFAMGKYLPPAAIPEPTAVGLFLLGGAVVARALYRSRK